MDQIRRDPNVLLVQHNHILPVVHPNNDTQPIVDEEPSIERRSWILLAENPGWGSYALPMMTTGPGAKLNTPIKNHDPANIFSQYNSDTGVRPGQGVDVYILDTGMKIDHPLFEGRATNFEGAAATTSRFCPGEPLSDLINHGTPVASCVGAITLGTAQAANLINVKVLCGTTSLSDAAIIQAIDAVTQNHNTRISDTDFKGSIINMSFGNTVATPAQETMLNQAKAAGIILVAAAGNDDANVARWPCAFASVICVGAVDNTYARWHDQPGGKDKGSNFGKHLLKAQILSG
jgi:subtilisin family serine protease